MDLNNLRRKPVWFANEAPDWAHTIWPRPESLNWFLKANKARLAEAGAIVRLGRDWLIDAERFPAVALEILNDKREAS